MNNKIKILVLMGGKSSEYYVSIASGREVVRNLSKDKFEVYPIVISKLDNSFRCIKSAKLLKLPDPFIVEKTGIEYVTNDYRKVNILDLAKFCDIAFIAMHGTNGEDGRIQGLLEALGILHTGSGVLTSAITMNKAMTKQLLIDNSVLTPRYILVNHRAEIGDILETFLKPPYFIKPNSQGSSVGSSMVKNKSDLKKAVNKAAKYDSQVLIEEYIKGTEITCSVIGNSNPEPLPLIEIVSENDFFDYQSKYLSNKTREVVPARLPITTTKKIQELGMKVYKILGCRGFSRIDMILAEDGRPYVLEVNTIPGLTKSSLFPKAAIAAGYDFSGFLEKIIDLAWES